MVQQEDSRFSVPLNGIDMRLRRSELAAVSSGLGQREDDVKLHGRLADALRALPLGERAPTWELVLRRFAHGKPLAWAAGEIGLDEVVAKDLLDRFIAQVLGPR